MKIGDTVLPVGDTFSVVGYYLDAHEHALLLNITETTTSTLRVSSLLFGISRKYLYQRPKLNYKLNKAGKYYQYQMGDRYYMVILLPNYKENGKVKLIDIETKETIPYVFRHLAFISPSNQPGFALISKTFPTSDLQGTVIRLYVFEDRRRFKEKNYTSPVREVNENLIKQLKNSSRNLKIFVEVQTSLWSYIILPNLLKN